MNPTNAKRTLLVSLLISAAVITLSREKGTQDLPRPRRYLGLAGTYIFAALLVEIAPPIGAGVAVLIAVSILLANGEEALDTIGTAAERGPRAFQSLASVVPAATLGSTIAEGKDAGTDFRISPGGGWGGSRGVVRSLTSSFSSRGLRLKSAKRRTKTTTSGSISDHWTGCELCYAEDWTGTVSAMDDAAVDIARKLGLDSYRRGTPLVHTTTQNGYRIQALYRTEIGGDHFGHIHTGARRVTGGLAQ